MADALLLGQAAQCYQSGGALYEAARCYREAGQHRAAADLFRRIGWHREAAEQYAAVGMLDEGAWLLVHLVGDARAAREVLTRAVPGDAAGVGATGSPILLRRIVLARCDVAEGVDQRQVLKVLAEAQRVLAQRHVYPDWRLRDWSVAVAEAAGRYDQVALLFAAALRGGRRDTAQRWQDWSDRVHSTSLQLPAPPPPAAAVVTE